MNEDLKAYIDGELPPDAAERLRAALEREPALHEEAAAFRRLAEGLRRLPEPEPVGRAATLAALGRRRPSLVRGWTVALAGCAAVLLVASRLPRFEMGPRTMPTRIDRPSMAAFPEATLASARREALIRYVHGLGGMTRPDDGGLRAFYPESAHDGLKRRFLLPDDLPWPSDGLRIRFSP